MNEQSDNPDQLTALAGVLLSLARFAAARDFRRIRRTGWGFIITTQPFYPQRGEKFKGGDQIFAETTRAADDLAREIPELSTFFDTSVVCEQLRLSFVDPVPQ